MVKVYDVRTMRDFQTLKGHKKEVCCEYAKATGCVRTLEYSFYTDTVCCLNFC